MAASVLGKRTRASCPSQDPSSGLPTRSKRIARSTPKKGNEEALFAIHQDDGIEGDVAGSILPVDSVQSPPVKAGSRVALSPSKANTLRNATTVVKEQRKLPQQPKQALTPSTPRHQRVSVAGIPLTPKTPKTPHTPRNRGSSARSIFNDARRVFSRGSESNRIVGRQNERLEVQDFISTASAEGAGGCLYVSGPPGTGKSALIGEVCDDYTPADAIHFAYVNCMSVKSAGDVYPQLVSELGISDDVFGGRAKDSLEAAISSRNDPSTYLVVLDEIDQLLNFDLNILYSLFEWSLRPASSLILIGIANALDLTDRFLPRLKARNLKPQLLPFLPYTVPEIASVLSSRARSLLSASTAAPPDFTPFLASSAVQLISKKIAAQTGDLRKAFDLAQKSIDLVEAETRDELSKQNDSQTQASPQRTPLGDNKNLSSPVGSQTSAQNTPMKCTKLPPPLPALSTYTPITAPRATISHVLRVTNLAFNATSASTRLRALNLQQKAALCAMLALERRNHLLSPPQAQSHAQFQTSLPSPLSTPTKKRIHGVLTTPSKRDAAASAAPTVREVFEAYKDLCRRDDVLHPLTHTEFRDVVSNLETSGLVEGVDARSSANGAFSGGNGPGTPRKRKGAGGAFGNGGVSGGQREGERKVKALVGWEEVGPALDGAGGEMLTRMVAGLGHD